MLRAPLGRDDITSAIPSVNYAEGIKDGHAGEMYSLVWIQKAPVEARPSKGVA